MQEGEMWAKMGSARGLNRCRSRWWSLVARSCTATDAIVAGGLWLTKGGRRRHGCYEGMAEGRECVANSPALWHHWC